MSTNQSELMPLEEYRGPEPVQRQLGGIEAESELSLLADSVAQDEIGGVSHSGVERRPNRSKQPIWWTPAWSLEMLSEGRRSVTNDCDRLKRVRIYFFTYLVPLFDLGSSDQATCKSTNVWKQSQTNSLPERHDSECWFSAK